MILILLLVTLIYIYFGYPLVLLLLNQFEQQKVKKSFITPSVSLIISAYNEEDIIAKKIKNCFQLNYPEDKLEIIVANDGSQDDTVEITSQYQEVELLDYEINEGKTEVQNKAVKEATGEILVFSDANAMYQPDAIKKLVRNFADEKVGAVCGDLQYSSGTASSGSREGISLYKRYEKFIKKLEGNLHSTIGAYGSIYAVRRELYTPLPADIISDFIEPLMIVKQGYRSVYEPEAVSVEKPETSYQDEFQRRVRIITRGLRGLVYASDLLKFNALGFCLFSRKLLRWLTPIFMILLFMFNLFHVEGIYFYLLIGQILFYSFAGLGLVFDNKLFYIPSYFTMINYASLKALINYFKGEKYVSWDTLDRKED